MPLYSTALHPAYNTGGGVLEYDVALTAATTTTGGAVLSLLNPFGVDVIIISSQVDIQTAATTSTNTFDLGIAANGTTSNDTLYDGQTTTAGIKTPGGTNGAVPRKLTSAQYLTATASATLAGMVAILHIQAVRA